MSNSTFQISFKKCIGILIIASGICLAGLAQDSDWQFLLHATNPNARLEAIETLVQLKIPQPIFDSLDDSDPFVRTAARMGLERIGGPAIDFLLSHLRSGDGALGYKASHVLMNMLGRDPLGRADILSNDLKSTVLQALASRRCFEDACLESWVRPIYVLPRRARVDGRVWTSFRIGKNGQPVEISAKGHPLLVSVAESSLKQWRFSTVPDVSTHNYSVVFDFVLVPPEEYSNSDDVEFFFPNHVISFGHPSKGSIDSVYPTAPPSNSTPKR